MKTRGLLTQLLIGFSLLAIGCGEGGSSTPSPAVDLSATPLPGEDTEGPTIRFTPIADGQPVGVSVEVSAAFEDDSGLSTATLHYRASGTQYWGSAFFSGDGETQHATIPDTYVQMDGVDYYIEAVDDAYQRNVSYAYQEDGSPYHFAVALDKEAFPYETSFEPASETERSSWRLAKTGWSSYIQDFNDGENWYLTQAEAHTGDFSAYHGPGSPYQSAPFLDYLVSPPIDLTTVSGAIDLTWWETVAVPESAEHQLWASVGSPDPADGDYVALSDPLEVGDGADLDWVRSRHVDLSAFAGAPQLFVAFVYQGLWADHWSIDDVALTAAAPDLSFEPATLEPEFAEPGESTQLTFHVTNQGVEPALGVHAILTTEDSLLAIDQPELALGEIAAGAALDVGPFLLSIDPTHPEDVTVDLTLTLSDAQSQWQDEVRLRVGAPPIAQIQITHEFAHDIQLFIGYGDPMAPTFYQVIQQDEGGDSAGTFTWEVDLSEQAEALPPDLEAHRWFVEVWDDSIGNAGTLDQVAIRMGDTVYENDGLPRAIPDDGSSLFAYLPGQAGFALGSLSPNTLSPGETVSLTLVLNNLAATPQGALSGSLETDSASVLSLDGAARAFPYTAFEEPQLLVEDGTSDGDGEGGDGTPTEEGSDGGDGGGDGGGDDGGDGGAEEAVAIVYVFGQATQETPFTFTVDPAHLDSRPLPFTLRLTDGVDDWEIPISLPVPYPVLGGMVLRIEDEGLDGAEGDGILSPGETAGLRLMVRNAGTLASFGPVSGGARLIENGDTGATLVEESVDFISDEGTAQDPILPGDGGKASSTLAFIVPGGSVGDTLELQVWASDGVTLLQEVRTLTLGEALWNPLTPTGDPAGDAEGTPLDLAEGFFRLEGSLLTLRWRAHQPFDIADTYVYAFVSNGAEYQYALYYSEVLVLYRWYTSGDGYWYRNYSQPDSMAARQTDADTIELELDLSTLGLSGGPLYGGAAVDNCLGSTACDYAPDSAVDGTGLTRFWW